MSSTYRVLCLSHDPAITVGGDYHTGYQSPSEAEAAITAGAEGHGQCDLLIGRYSYPLVEVGCPSTLPERSGRYRCGVHSGTQWADVAWLRILAAVHQTGTEQAKALTRAGTLRCWPWERLRRLRDGLDIDLAELVGTP